MDKDLQGTEKADLVVVIRIALANLAHAVNYSQHKDELTSGFRTGQKVAYETVLAYLTEDDD